jgi:hypothetical protein
MIVVSLATKHVLAFTASKKHIVNVTKVKTPLAG